MRRKKRTLKLDDEMDITPMIDVTFLLLMFLQMRFPSLKWVSMPSTYRKP